MRDVSHCFALDAVKKDKKINLEGMYTVLQKGCFTNIMFSVLESEKKTGRDGKKDREIRKERDR